MKKFVKVILSALFFSLAMFAVNGNHIALAMILIGSSITIWFTPWSLFTSKISSVSDLKARQEYDDIWLATAAVVGESLIIIGSILYFIG